MAIGHAVFSLQIFLLAQFFCKRTSDKVSFSNLTELRVLRCAGIAGAVSYTHLDVYKRQLPTCLSESQTSFLADSVSASLWDVDVYKRQLLHCAQCWSWSSRRESLS